MNGLETEYNGALECEVRSAQDDKGKAEVTALGFKSHGLVVYDMAGNILTKVDGHSMSEEAVRNAAKTVM